LHCIKQTFYPFLFFAIPIMDSATTLKARGEEAARLLARAMTSPDDPAHIKPAVRFCRPPMSGARFVSSWTLQLPRACWDSRCCGDVIRAATEFMAKV
jgi:hypothetical protein